MKVIFLSRQLALWCCIAVLTFVLCTELQAQIETCCDVITVDITPTSSSEETECCYTISGNTGSCSTYDSYTITENGATVVNAALTSSGTFSTTICRPIGTAGTFHITFHSGIFTCERDLQYGGCLLLPVDPNPNCCESIHIQALFVGENCCYALTSLNPWACTTIYSYAIKQLTGDGSWFVTKTGHRFDNSPINSDFFNDENSTNQIYCVDILHGHTVNYVQKIRIVFYDNLGRVVCFKELDLDCNLAIGGGGGLGKMSSNSMADNNVANTLSNIGVTPNPVSDEATINFEALASTVLKVEVCNSAGQCFVVQNDVTVKRGHQSITVPMQGFSSGVYTILLKANGYTYTQSVSVVR